MIFRLAPSRSLSPQPGATAASAACPGDKAHRVRQTAAARAKGELYGCSPSSRVERRKGFGFLERRAVLVSNAE